jgi:hypothetical protein
VRLVGHVRIVAEVGINARDMANYDAFGRPAAAGTLTSGERPRRVLLAPAAALLAVAAIGGLLALAASHHGAVHHPAAAKESRIGPVTTPVAFSHDSLLVPANLRPALRLALEQGHGRVLSVTVSPNAFDVIFAPHHGRSFVVTVTASGNVATGHQSEQPDRGFPASRIDPSAPARFVAAAARRLGVPVRTLIAAGLQRESGGLQWSAAFDGRNQAVYGTPDGTVTGTGP